jgi:hypothetical protein
MTTDPILDASSQRRRRFLKAIASAAGIAVVSPQQAFGSSLLMPSLAGPAQEGEPCTSTRTKSGSHVVTKPSYFTTAYVSWSTISTKAWTFSCNATYVSSYSETYYVPDLMWFTLVRHETVSFSPPKTYSGAATMSWDGTGFSYTEMRAFDVTYTWVYSETETMSLGCQDAKALSQGVGLSEIPPALQVRGLPRHMVDSPEDLHGVNGLFGRLRHLNI